ncbi:MAG: class I SAM-dependent methyltransferase [Acidimicrobiales bacterium]
MPRDALSFEEIRQLDAENTSRAWIATRLIASHPRLIPHAVSTAARGALRGASTAVQADPALGWMAAADQVHRIAPGAVFGADWGGLETFATTFGEHVGRDQVALEIGCGGGRVTRRLQPLVAELDAVDVSQVILDEARAVAPNVRYSTVTGFGDSFADDRYDAVASHDVFVHFELDECARYLHNIARTLRPKGVLIVSVYTLDSDAEYEEYRTEISNSTQLTARRVRRFPSETYEKLLDIFGFEVTDRRRAEPGEYPRLSLAVAGGGETPHLNFVARKI